MSENYIDKQPDFLYKGYSYCCFMAFRQCFLNHETDEKAIRYNVF